MEDIVTAFLIGLSFGNMWMCVVLVFSLQGANKETAVGFLVGRASAVVLLSVAVSLLGRAIDIPRSTIDIVSGVVLFLFAAYLLATRFFSWIPPWKKVDARGAVDSNGVASCSGDCATCTSRAHLQLSACSGCSAENEGICEAHEPEVEPLVVSVASNGAAAGFASKFIPGFSIGFLRGGAMCAKLAVILPLLLRASVGKAFAIALAFSVSSSLYPILGFLFGNVALKFVNYKRWVFLVGCLFMTAFSIHYISKGLGI